MRKNSSYPQVRPATDIVDKEDGVQIKANMPGVEEKNLQIFRKEGVLHIQASSRCPVPEEKKDVRTLEFGNVEFTLDILMKGALSAPVETSLSNGVLSVFLPHQSGGGELPVIVR